MSTTTPRGSSSRPGSTACPRTPEDHKGSLRSALRAHPCGPRRTRGSHNGCPTEKMSLSPATRAKGWSHATGGHPPCLTATKPSRNHQLQPPPNRTRPGPKPLAKRRSHGPGGRHTRSAATSYPSYFSRTVISDLLTVGHATGTEHAPGTRGDAVAEWSRSAQLKELCAMRPAGPA